MFSFIQNLQRLFHPRRELNVSGTHPYRHLPVLLVTGQGRSGTTVVRNALAVHPSIDSKNTESNTFFEFLDVVHKHHEHINRQQNLAVSWSEYCELVANMLLNMHWPNPRPPENMPQLLSTYSITNPPTAETFKRLFPNARFCYVLRNGIEVVSSRMNFDALPFRDNSFEEHCGTWATSVSDMLHWGSGRNDFVIFRHDWLLDRDRARTGMRQVVGDLAGDDDLDEMVDVIFANQFHPTSFDNESAERANDLTQRSRRWELWTHEQKVHFRNACGDAMQLAGYDIPE